MLVTTYAFLGLLVLFLALLLQTGLKLRQAIVYEEELLKTSSILRWPSVALIVPVGGNDPRIRASLTSLIRQDYPSFTLILVTATSHEPAATLIQELKREYPRIWHVVAGPALNCGQKNHNLLRGVAAIERSKPDCYVFCDSTHLAKPNFLQLLIQPIARGSTRISTGYHEVAVQDGTLTSLAYAISVLFMRLLQAIAVFTQPWGGAMAFTRETFVKAEIAKMWANTVVDDCTLVAYLQKKHIPVELAAGAVVTTNVERYPKDTWEAWLERQILFPRFCAPLQWWLLGVMTLLLLTPPFIALEDFVLSLEQGLSPRILLPIGFILVPAFLIASLRIFLPQKTNPLKFLAAFLLALGTFLKVYLGTFGVNHILWQNKVYKVGRGGVVLEVLE